MKQLLIDHYNKAISELEQIRKTRLTIKERVALEKAVTNLEALRRTLSYVNITPIP